MIKQINFSVRPSWLSAAVILSSGSFFCAAVSLVFTFPLEKNNIRLDPRIIYFFSIVSFSHILIMDSIKNIEKAGISMSFVKHRWRPKWAALLVAGTLLTSLISPALPAARAEEGTPKTEVSYSDLSSSYASKEIASLTASGILDGFDDGTFRPAAPVTRAQFAKVIASILNLKAEPEIAGRFQDVPADAWYAGYTGALVKEGITDGVSEKEFAPDKIVTREELAAFFMRALQLTKSAQALPADSSIFADFGEISSWAQYYVSFAYKIGFLQGSEDESGKLLYQPKAQADRQALARLAYELLENKDAYLEKAAALATPAASAAPSPSPTASIGGGGGGGGGAPGTPKPSAPPAPTAPADGSTLTDLPAGNYAGSFTVAAGSTVFGPQTGTATISGTLTVNPGPSGEVTLRNVHTANLRVLSGSDHSVILQGVKVSGTLTVNTGTQNTPVRILTQQGTAITQTLVESAAILEVPAGSAGDVTIAPSAAGKAIELRGSFTGTVRSQAPGVSIVVRDSASVRSVIMEANGQLQADGIVSAYGILNPNVQVQLSGAKTTVLKENAAKTAKEAIQGLGDVTKLALEDQARVLDIVSQYNALQAMNMADSITGQIKDQLQAAQTQMKALTKAEAEKKLGELPDYKDFNWSDRAKLEPKLVIVQQTMDISTIWGNQEWELTGYQNWRNLRDYFSYRYFSLSTQLLEGNIVIAGTSLPHVTVSIDKIIQSPEFKVIHIGETFTDESGQFIYMDDSHFPLMNGEVFSFTVSNPLTGFSTQLTYTVSTISSKTAAPPVIQPYYESDPLQLDYGTSFADYQYLLVLNKNKEVLHSGVVMAHSKLFVYFDGPVKPAPGETLTVYAQGQYYSRAISDPVQVKVLANKDSSQQPVVPEIYDGDFILTIPATEGAMVTVERNGETLWALANFNNKAEFQLQQKRFQQGEEISVTLKEPSKNPSTPVIRQVLPTSGKSVQPSATLTEGDKSVTIYGQFPSDSSLLVQWGESSTAWSPVFQLGTSPDGIVNFNMSFSTDNMYDKSVYLYLKTPGKGLSNAQKLTFTPQTKLYSSGGSIYTDSVNLKVTAEPGSVVTIERQNGAVIYEQQGSADSNVILLDSMRLNETLWNGETVYLTATASGKKPSNPQALQVSSNQNKTSTPVVAGTLVLGMEKPVLSILSETYKFEAFIETPEGTEVSADELVPRTEFGFSKQFDLNPQLLKGASKLLISIKEHGKEKSDPVEVPIYDASHGTYLQTVTQTVYQSTNPLEFIKGMADPLSTISLQTAEGQTIAHGEASILGSFQLVVPHGSLVPNASLYLTAKAKGLPTSNTVTLSVYAAEGETPKPIAPEWVESGGTMIKLDMEAPAGSFVTIYKQDGTLLDSGYWKGETGTGMVVSTIYFDVGQLDQTLIITAQLPGHNPSENIEVQVRTNERSDFTSSPINIKTLFDYPGGLTKITGRTADPFTLIRGGVVQIYSDINGDFELYVPTKPLVIKWIEFQAPGERAITYPILMSPEMTYIYEQGGGSDSGVNIGGGGGGGGVSPGGASGTTNP